MPILIGLNSGTSADGIDAVLVHFQGSGLALEFAVLAESQVAHPQARRALLRQAPDLDLRTVALLNRDLGDAFADAALAVIGAAGLSPSSVAAIGCHGQTVFHAPEQGITVQIGDAERIAERTGCLTVHDFRSRDVAAGGEGAPLSPYLDWLAARGAAGTVVLNLGGIANATAVAPRFEDCVAGDLGPANLPLDLLAIAASAGQAECDLDGARARRGRVDEKVVQGLIATDEYLARSFPKSTGRERYGAPFVTEFLRRTPHLNPDDRLATATAFVGAAVAQGISALCGGQTPMRVLVAGGGAKNPALVGAIESRLGGLALEPFAWRGLGAASREAFLFALLAHESLQGVKTSLPAATGAREARVLGRIARGFA